MTDTQPDSPQPDPISGPRDAGVLSTYSALARAQAFERFTKSCVMPLALAMAATRGRKVDCLARPDLLFHQQYSTRYGSKVTRCQKPSDKGPTVI
jgi:hypothetical protein